MSVRIRTKPEMSRFAGMLSRGGQRLRSLPSVDRGQMAILLALSVIPIALVTGFAIDFQMLTTKKKGMERGDGEKESMMHRDGKGMESGRPKIGERVAGLSELRDGMLM